MSYKIIGKYIKELKFNIPNTKAFFLIAENISNYKVNIDIKSNQIKENIIEVLTTLSLSSVKDKIDKINTNIVFASVVEFKNNNIEKREIEKIILVKVPSEIYGELRKIFVSLFESSGFKDIKINENVDFQKLYEMRKIQ